MTPTTRRLYAAVRAIHIYLTMVGLILLLFFAATGFMLNHPGWFSLDVGRYRDVTGQVPAALLDPVDDLQLVEHLRERYGVAGRVSSFSADEQELRVAFRRAGHYLADAAIDRATGSLQMTIETHGLGTLLADLHRGSETGAVWSLLIIDASAALLVVVSLTGLVMLLILPRYRRHTLIGLALSGVAAAGLYVAFVP